MSSDITVFSFCETIARAEIVEARRYGGRKEVLINPADIWTASGHDIECVMSWYTLSLVKLKETIPDDFIDAAVRLVHIDRKEATRNVLTEYNKTMLSRPDTLVQGSLAWNLREFRRARVRLVKELRRTVKEIYQSAINSLKKLMKIFFRNK